MRLLQNVICKNMLKTFPITFYLRETKENIMPKDSEVYTIIRNLGLIVRDKIKIDDSTVNNNFNWGGQLEVVNLAPMPIERPTPCLHSIEQLAIFPNGDVTACGMVDFKKRMILGNILEEGIDVFKKTCSMELCNNCNEYEPEHI